jgi:hypothetical protein
MLLNSFDELFTPTNIIWENLDFKNIEYRDKINLLLKNKKLIHTFDDDIDNFILNAINYYDNLNIFIVFGKNKNNTYKYYEETFKDDYSLYGIKSMNIKFSMINKIMYQLLFARMIIKNKSDMYEHISENFKYISEYKETMIDITILIVKKKDNSKKYPNSDIIGNDYIVYIPNTKEQICNSICVFFSNTTLNFLEKQNFDYFLTKDMEPSKKMFLKYKKWLQTNINQLDQSKCMLFSSIVLYLLGHRNMNDLDLYIHTVSKEVEMKFNELNNNEIFNFIEFKIKNTENWPKHWNSWLDIWAQKCGAKYFEEILGNPKYHFYFLGVKIISLECDVIRRLERSRPRAYADLIALRKRYSYKIDIPQIPETSLKYIPLKDISEDEKIELLRNNGILNEDNDEICITYNNDISKFINTIIYALHTRYKMKFTIEEIKKELNMLSRYELNDFNRNQLNNSDKKQIKIVIRKLKN